MRALRVSPDLQLPPEAATETFGLLAVRGAGKSNAARVLAEEMFEASIPFVAVDPFGSWWGLRASREGGGPGIPIPIFGGAASGEGRASGVHQGPGGSHHRRQPGRLHGHGPGALQRPCAAIREPGPGGPRGGTCRLRTP